MSETKTVTYTLEDGKYYKTTTIVIKDEYQKSDLEKIKSNLGDEKAKLEALDIAGEITKVDKEISDINKLA